MSSSLTVATFNANSVRARMPVLVRWLEKNRPDVLCLQETKVRDEEFPLDPLRGFGYQVLIHGQKSYNGVAVLTREPPLSWSSGLPDRAEPDQARLIELELPGLILLNAYVPQGQSVDSPKYAYKLEWLERFRAHLESRHAPDRPILWVGDLNVAYEDRDVHDPKRLKGHVCFNPELTAAFRRVLDWGFLDVFRKHRRESGIYTFWDYRVPNALNRGVGWRIDHILATIPLAERSEDVWVDAEPRTWSKPSDHTFVLARFAR